MKKLLLAVLVFSGCVEQEIKIVEVSPREKPLNEMIQLAAHSYGLDWKLLDALVEQESGYQADAVRFESHLYERLNEKNASKRMQLASSHGLTQVLGIEAKRRGVSFAELYNPEVSLEVGANMLADCIERSKATKRMDKIKEGLSCYNSGKHRSTQGQEYAQKVLLKYLERKI